MLAIQLSSPEAGLIERLSMVTWRDTSIWFFLLNMFLLSPVYLYLLGQGLVWVHLREKASWFFR